MAWVVASSVNVPWEVGQHCWVTVPSGDPVGVGRTLVFEITGRAGGRRWFGQDVPDDPDERGFPDWILNEEWPNTLVTGGPDEHVRTEQG